MALLTNVGEVAIPHYRAVPAVDRPPRVARRQLCGPIVVWDKLHRRTMESTRPGETLGFAMATVGPHSFSIHRVPGSRCSASWITDDFACPLNDRLRLRMPRPFAHDHPLRKKFPQRTRPATLQYAAGGAVYECISQSLNFREKNERVTPNKLFAPPPGTKLQPRR